MKRLLIQLFTLLWTLSLQAETIYIVPFLGLDPAVLFYEPYTYRDEVAKPFCLLREELEREGYTIQFTRSAAGLEDVSAIIVLNDFSEQFIDDLSAYPREKCFLFAFEPPVVHPHLYDSRYAAVFGKIFVMFDDVVDNISFFKFHFPQPRLQMIEQSVDFEEKKLCTMIASNKYSSLHPDSAYEERRKLISFFEMLGTGDFDLYGHHWSGPTYKGVVEKKWEVFKNYRFSFCYENMQNQNGYITEKIFDALIGGSVPIYLGASNIADYVPKECFIDRRAFSSDEELYHFLKNMNRETHEAYISAINDYLASPKAWLFSSECFVQLVKEAINSSH